MACAGGCAEDVAAAQAVRRAQIKEWQARQVALDREYHGFVPADEPVDDGGAHVAPVDEVPPFEEIEAPLLGSEPDESPANVQDVVEEPIPKVSRAKSPKTTPSDD